MSKSFYKIATSVFHVSMKSICTLLEVSVGCISIDLGNLHDSKNIFHLFSFKTTIIYKWGSPFQYLTYPLHLAVQHRVIPKVMWKLEANEKLWKNEI